MALLPPYPTHLAVRWIHVLGMAALVGGAVLVWLVLRRDPARETPATALQVAVAYESVFWAAAGLVVLTGVGNLGAMAPAIPGPGTAWGVTFSVKLVGAFGLLVGSVVRTLGVVRLCVEAPEQHGPRVIERLGVGYGATAVYLLIVVMLAEVLAHG